MQSSKLILVKQICAQYPRLINKPKKWPKKAENAIIDKINEQKTTTGHILKSFLIAKRKQPLFPS